MERKSGCNREVVSHGATDQEDLSARLGLGGAKAKEDERASGDLRLNWKVKFVAGSERIYTKWTLLGMEILEVKRVCHVGRYKLASLGRRRRSKQKKKTVPETTKRKGDRP